MSKNTKIIRILITYTTASNIKKERSYLTGKGGLMPMTDERINQTI